MKTSMKRKTWVAVVLLVTMLLAAGCGGQQKTAEEVNYDSAQAVAMMDGIMTYQPGTAGASLKLYIATFAVLNFAETYDHATQQDFLYADMKDYLEGLTDEQVAQVKDALPEINALAQIVFMDGAASMEAALSDAGITNFCEEYDAEKYEHVMDILDLAL